MRPILVVDDSRTWRTLIGVVLASLGREILLANTAMASFAIAKARQPALVVLDVDMPGDMQGDTLARHFRSATPPLRVLLHSSMAESELEHLANEIGCEWRSKIPGGIGLREHVRQLLQDSA